MSKKNRGQVDEKVPFLLVAIGGFSLLLGLWVSPLVSVLGVLTGVYIYQAHPANKIHWQIPVITNGLVVLLWVITLTAFYMK